MQKIFLCLVVLGLSMILAGSVAAEQKVLTMSTTTSTQASGLLDVLLPAFKEDTGITVKVIAKGTGAAIRDGKDGNVDVIFVHAKNREKHFVDEGYGTKRYAVMHNDFIIIGPEDDPAGIKGMSNVQKALEKIADAGAPFVSRGDDSGTHTKEQILWESSDVALEEVTKSIVEGGSKTELSYVQPEQTSTNWYYSIGQGMGKTVTFAEEKQAYTLADRGTYIKNKLGRDVGLDLQVVCEGDEELYNPYGVIPVNPERYPEVKFDLAKQFAQWLVSEPGQSVIANYRLHGKQLFYPDAMPNVQ
ncbi:MAG: substrate-binding domain-containing protein [Desulfohalobium sp.]